MKRLIVFLLLVSTSAALGAQVYVSTDKGAYVAGDRIWCSVFCAPGPAVAYIELISTESVAARTRVDVRSGRGGGSLTVPFGTPTGKYRLVAYTDPSEADASSGPVLNVYNTLSTARVKDGVEVVDSVPSSEAAAMQAGYGISGGVEGQSLKLGNDSGRPVTLSVSLYREDSLEPASRQSIAGFTPGPASEESSGERLRARIVGEADGDLTGIIAVPGAKTYCYSALAGKDGSFCFDTENIFGSRDLVCQLSGLKEGSKCHLEIENPFAGPSVDGLERLRICRSQEADLVRRSAAMKTGAATDTLAVSLPMRREHFFLTHECISYVLDDYTRFPTMEEVFVEIIPQVKLRRRDGKPRIYTLMQTSVADAQPRWGDTVVMIDGVPVLDQSLVEKYDPAIVKVVEVYPCRYVLGESVFDGVVNLVTFKGDMPGVLFDDNVRIYSFEGCSLPQVHRGTETLYWNPLVSVGKDGTFSVDVDGLRAGERYTLCAEGLTDTGRAVYFRKTFVR